MKKVICLLCVFTFSVCLIMTNHCSADDSVTRFTDVSENAWYAESVEYVRENGLMNGITAETFEPEMHITRGMIVTIVYRMEGSPKTAESLKFSDVNEKSYYAEPIIWASENNIVNGYGDGTFLPDEKITREQFAAILYRYAKHKGLDVSKTEKLQSYSDSDSISEYAISAFSWANASKLITGMTTETLVPKGIATRAQAATVFMRFETLLEQTEDNASDERGEQEDNTNPEDKADDSNRDDTSNGDGSSSDNGDKNDANHEEKENIGNDNETADNPEHGEWEDSKPEEPTIYVESAIADGEYVEAVISVMNNPGIASIKFDVEYSDKLKLISVDFDSRWGDYITAPTPYKNPQTVNLISPFENITKDGRLATFKFQIMDKSYDKTISVKCDKNNIFDSDFVDVIFDVKDGEIKNKE